MVNITIKNYVQYAYTYEEGQVIYDLLAPPLMSGEDVVLSFEGLKSVPSSFVNAALLQLVDQLPISEIKRRLKIVDSTNFINEMIHIGFDTAIAKKDAGG